MDRYGLRASAYRLPKGQEKRDAWAAQVGRDGQALLSAVYAEREDRALRTEPAVETLRLVWLQNVVTVNERLRWRTNDETPPTGRSIGSPYDVDARYATKRQTHWVGSKIHLTETYGDDQPNLITKVETTHAAVSDDAVTEPRSKPPMPQSQTMQSPKPFTPRWLKSSCCLKNMLPTPGM